MNPISVDRVFGNYPISIASSLALEGLTHTGEYADWSRGKEQPPIHQFQAFYLNIRTLFRNAFYAFEENRDSLRADTIRTCIEEDIQNIIATAQAVAPSMVCVPYLCQYKTVNKMFPEAAFKNANTESQIFYNSLEMDVYRMVGNEKLWDTQLFDCEIKGEQDTVILTHLPLDLLSRKHFPKLALIESHTGKLKTHLEWNSKLYNKPLNVPFNKAFLTLFGDGIMFSPQDLKVRRVVLKAAEKYHWRADTTMDRIKLNLKLMNEPHVMAFLDKLGH